jgi:hypothetical protein
MNALRLAALLVALGGGTAAALLLACSEDGSSRDEPTEAGTPPVTITVLNHLGPEQGVLVVFHDGAGNVTATALTNALGQVTQVVGPGSQVTVVGSPLPSMTSSAVVRVDTQNVVEADGSADADGSPSDAGAMPAEDGGYDDAYASPFATGGEGCCDDDTGPPVTLRGRYSC